MKAVLLGIASSLALALSLSVWVNLAAALSESVVGSPEITGVVSVVDVQSRDGSVSGVVVNRSPKLVRDVQLLVRHAWLWKNERHPGEDPPGRSEFYTLRDQIPPGGSVPFTYNIPPLPERSDGHFVTTVEVVGFTEVGA